MMLTMYVWQALVFCWGKGISRTSIICVFRNGSKCLYIFVSENTFSTTRLIITWLSSVLPWRKRGSADHHQNCPSPHPRNFEPYAVVALDCVVCAWCFLGGLVACGTFGRAETVAETAFAAAAVAGGFSIASSPVTGTAVGRTVHDDFMSWKNISHHWLRSDSRFGPSQWDGIRAH